MSLNSGRHLFSRVCPDHIYGIATQAYKKMCKVSIITVNYNNAQGLKKTMSSVFSQEFTNYEYIIIDGGSTDSSTGYIKDHAQKIFYWISEKDNGVYDAMNKGIEKATGEYLIFLNSGDCFVNDQVLLDFSKQAAINKAAIYYGNIQSDDAVEGVKTQHYPSPLGLDFWEHYTINHQASFIKSPLFKTIGFYDTRYSLAADYAFFLQCFIAGHVFEHINKPLVHYNLAGASSLNKDIYRQQMQLAWKNNIPPYLEILYRQQKEHDHLMQHRIMRMAKNIQEKYSRLRRIFK